MTTTYQTSKYLDLQTAVLIFLASEERFFRTAQVNVDKPSRSRTAKHHFLETAFPDTIKIMIENVQYVVPASAKPYSRKLEDVSARLHELEESGLLRKEFPFYPGTEYQSYSITVEGSRFVNGYLYDLVPLILDARRIQRILGKVDGFESAKSWLRDLSFRFKAKPSEELVNEMLMGIRQFMPSGIYLLQILNEEINSKAEHG